MLVWKSCSSRLNFIISSADFPEQRKVKSYEPFDDFGGGTRLILNVSVTRV